MADTICPDPGSPETVGAPASEVPPAAPEVPPDPAAPPSAAIVAAAAITERELDLERKLKAIEADKRQVEMRAAELQDENYRLKQIGVRPAAPAAPVKPKTWTLFED